MSDDLPMDPDVPSIELDAGAARTIAAGMREVAMADGMQEDEAALIDAFEASLPAGPPSGPVNLQDLRTDHAKAAFVQSLVLVAYADGKVSEAEQMIIRRYALQLGFDEDSLARVWTDVAVDLLSTFSAVTVFRSDIEAVGRSMGLGDADVARALAD